MISDKGGGEEWCVGNFIGKMCAPRKLGKMCMSAVRIFMAKMVNRGKLKILIIFAILGSLHPSEGPLKDLKP